MGQNQSCAHGEDVVQLSDLKIQGAKARDGAETKKRNVLTATSASDAVDSLRSQTHNDGDAAVNSPHGSGYAATVNQPVLGEKRSNQFPSVTTSDDVDRDHDQIILLNEDRQLSIDFSNVNIDPHGSVSIIVSDNDKVRRLPPPKSNIQKPRTKRTKNKNSVKKRPWRFQWRKKRIKEEVVTTGITMKLDDSHTMLLFIPSKKANAQSNTDMKRKTANVIGGIGREKMPQAKQSSSPIYGSEECDQAVGVANAPGHPFQVGMTTRLVIKDVDEMRNIVSMKMKGKKDCFVDSIIVCGVQIFVTRCRPDEGTLDVDENANDTNVAVKGSSRSPPGTSSPQCESAPTRRRKHSFSSDLLPASSSNGCLFQASNVGGLNVVKPSTLKDEKLDELLTICKTKLRFEVRSGNRSRAGEVYSKRSADGNYAVVGSIARESATPAAAADASGPQRAQYELLPKTYDLFGHPQQFAKVFSAVIPLGIGRKLYTPDAVFNNSVDAVDEMICVDKANRIYVCDIGLTSAQCDFIIDTTERCSHGTYAAYTYAKQTLGCRDYDELATVCEWPVMRAYSSICNHLENNEEGESKRVLVLDEREPHLVKYDTSKKERQKLDMHTDKSEWTFLIALSDGDGADYDGGGTYLECIDATIHLQKGHALIFPGKRRHRGQKIFNGSRFLLVGFLVEKTELDEESDSDGATMNQNDANSAF